ncbi:MAG TPA: EpsI family protein [Blastocatellia bacterium]|jgi:EpsI family protein|nr:EpsI family protein [Blastocatellia bacterium]
MKSSSRFGLLLVVLVAGGILVNTWAYLGEAHVERQELKNFPIQVGAWKQEGVDQRFDAQTMSVLRASDYLLRDYRLGNGQMANLYIGYYATQRDGASYHSPLNCLPGAGWSMVDPAMITIRLPNGKSFLANKYVVENGNIRELMIYWYQGRGRMIASEYWGKIYTVLDSVRLRRSDAAMVRVMVPITASDTAAIESAREFAAVTSEVLPEFVPN